MAPQVHHRPPVPVWPGAVKLLCAGELAGPSRQPCTRLDHGDGNGVLAEEVGEVHLCPHLNAVALARLQHPIQRRGCAPVRVVVRQGGAACVVEHCWGQPRRHDEELVVHDEAFGSGLRAELVRVNGGTALGLGKRAHGGREAPRPLPHTMRGCEFSAQWIGRSVVADRWWLPGSSSVCTHGVGSHPHGDAARAPRADRTERLLPQQVGP